MPVNNEQRIIDDPLLPNGLLGSKKQRAYARQLARAAKERDIIEYVGHATAEGEQASIAGALNWLDPGRHGNLKGEYEWYTPQHVIDAVHEVMGGIDVDPASNPIANEVVKATIFYTQEQNGLEQKWTGRVFVNPPFAHPTVKHFAEKLMDSFGEGETKQAVWLSNACVDVGWWQDLSSVGIICFPRGRLKFYGPDGTVQPPTLGQSIIYLGDNRAEFRKEFLKIGVVVQA